MVVALSTSDSPATVKRNSCSCSFGSCDCVCAPGSSRSTTPSTETATRREQQNGVDDINTSVRTSATTMSSAFSSSSPPPSLGLDLDVGAIVGVVADQEYEDSSHNLFDNDGDGDDDDEHDDEHDNEQELHPQDQQQQPDDEEYIPLASSTHSSTTPSPHHRRGIMVSSRSSSSNSSFGLSNHSTGGSRRQLLRVGSWMKQSWRSMSSTRSLASLSSATSFNNGHNNPSRGDGGHEGDNEKNETIVKVPKNVTFEKDEYLVSTIPSFSPQRTTPKGSERTEGEGERKHDVPADSTDSTQTELWFDDHDYKMFEKDRVLSILGYEAMKRGSTAFDASSRHHDVRGLEASIDANYKKRQEGEKKDLYRAMKLEEKRQKDDGCFPDLDRFRVVSRRHTKGSQERSQRMGQEDAKAAGECSGNSSMKNSTSSKPKLFRRRSSKISKASISR